MVPTIYYAYFVSAEEFHRRHHVVHEVRVYFLFFAILCVDHVYFFQTAEIKKAGIEKLKSAIQLEATLLRQQAQRERARSRGFSLAKEGETPHSADDTHH